MQTESQAADRISPWVQVRTWVRHPHVYRRMILAASPDARPAEVVAIYDKAGRHAGFAHYNPAANVVLRVLTAESGPVDAGFWRNRIQQALTLRTDVLRLPQSTDAYRVIHAEGDGLPGLVVDRYGPVLSIECHSLGMVNAVPTLLPILVELTGSAQYTVGVGAATEAQEHFRFEPQSSPDLPSGVNIRENGVRFRVEFATGHKTGFFCDQRDNRLRLARLCQGREVLDLCCYTGGFGMYAAMIGGAASVTCVDLDEQAVAAARVNANLNNVRVKTVHSDAFTYARQMQINGRQFDALVLDPPKLVFGKGGAGEEGDVDDGRRKYHDLNTLAMTLVRRGGVMLTCSCSGALHRAEFLEIVAASARRAGRTLQVIEQTGAAADHPVRPEFPEGEYLKAVWLRVL